MASVPSKNQSASSSSVTIALTYTRVSTEDQAREGVSLDAQLADCRRYAANHGWSLGTEYQDILSGKRDDRPAYQRLLIDIRSLRSQGTSLVVVVARLDRFGRRLLERVRSREELKALGVAVHSVHEGGEVSDLVANMLGAVAQEEVRWLGERVSNARAYMRDRGFMPPGHATWGYIRRPATAEERGAGAPATVLDIDEEVAPYVRELFQRVADGQSVRTATRWVRSLPPHLLRGKTLAMSPVARLLRSPTYIARGPQGREDVVSRPIMRWPALVDDALWLRVQMGIDDHTHHRHQASRRYLLTGYLRCPRCGGPTSGHKTPSRPQTRYDCAQERSQGTLPCSWSAPTRTIDAAVLDLVSRVLAPFASSDGGFRRAIERSWTALQQPDEVGAQREQRIARLRRQADRARERLANAAIMLVDGGIDREAYELVRDRSHGEIVAVDEELTRLEGTVRKPSLPALAEVLSQIGEWEGLLKQADIALQREVLAVLVQRVTPIRTGYGRYGVQVVWTPTGAALAELAGIGDTEPSDLKVVPFIPYADTMVECSECGKEFKPKGWEQYCEPECRRAASRKRRRERRAAHER